ncbi:MAG: type I restriction enzyme S subunit [Cognaticolwellia sp.]|jgi:type I restriction enzyme S subunit
MQNNSVLANKLIGEIPKDWSYINLKEIYVKPIRDFGSFSTTKLITFLDSGIPFIKSEMIKEGSIDWTSVHYISDDVHKLLNKSYIEKHTILFSKIGSALGKAVVYEGERGLCNSNAAVAKITLNNKVADNYYYTYLLNNSLAKKQFIRLIVSLLPRINLGDISDLILPLPPLVEQRKIANILGTWDKAISTTKRLIDNSKQQKKALMQQLLTGKKRLSAFDSEWKEIKLAEIGRCITGLTYSPSDIVDESGMLVLRSSNIQHGKLAYKDNVFVSSDLTIKSKTQNGDILVCIRNGSKNLIGKSALIKGKAANQAHGAFMTLFRCKYPDYTFQLFQSSHYYRQVHKNLGATINSINTSDLHKFKFMMPTDDNEINAIAACLSNADREIEVLEQQFADLQQEKKALMQQLLTGKRRVKVDNTEAA